MGNSLLLHVQSMQLKVACVVASISGCFFKSCFRFVWGTVNFAFLEPWDQSLGVDYLAGTKT